MKLVERIGVIGNGVVGGATARSWLEYAGEVRVYDINPDRCLNGLDATLDCDYVFICLPTPADDTGACDLQLLRNLFVKLNGCPANLVLRSTVPPGTTARFLEDYGTPKLIHSPEFLTARCSVGNALLPTRNIVGGRGLHSAGLIDLYRKRWPGVQCLYMSSTESELVKLVTNAFFATKISFFNEMRQVSEALDCTWDIVRRGVLSDGRIMPEHTLTPGPDGKLGFGGGCLTKDLDNLLNIAMEKGVLPLVISATGIKNKEVRYGKS